MAKSLESPTKLTEFAPLNPDEPQNPTANIIKSTFARWFGINSSSGSKASPQVANAEQHESSSSYHDSTCDDVSQSGESCVSSNPSYSEGRNLVSVLTRVSNLLAQNGMYSESEFKQFWMPDSVSKECYECSYKFTALRRRHHCRICGQIFCARCCHQQVPGKLMGHSGDLRACTYCCHIVLSCLQSIDTSSASGGIAPADLAAIQEDLQKKLALLQLPPRTAPNSGGGRSSNNSSRSPSGVNADPGSGSTVTDSSGKSRHLTLKRKVSVSFQEERFASGSSAQPPLLSSAERKVLLHDSIQLKALHEEMTHPVRGIQLQAHRYKLRSISNCCTGSELVDWLLLRDKASSRMQATAIGQALVDASFLDCLSSSSPSWTGIVGEADQQAIFVDGYALYRPKMVAGGVSSPVPPEQQAVIREEAVGSSEPDDGQEPLWVQQIGMPEEDGHHAALHMRPKESEETSSPSLKHHSRPSTLDVVDHSGKHLAVPALKRDELLSLSAELPANPALCSPGVQPESAGRTPQQPPEGSAGSGTGLPHHNEASGRLLAELFDDHMQRLVRQLLSWHGLALTWADVLLPLAREVAMTVRPDVRDDDDDMDIRQYVHIKKIPGGTKSDSRIVHGVVCSKNVANRSMPKWSHDPNILLLSSAIDYQRVESKLISLEPLMMQENEYLKNAVAKIAAFKPEVLLVEKVVSGVAQEFLSNLGVTLVLNVKPAVMDRVSRSCQADIVPSIDAHQLSRPKLGSCRLFHVETVVLDRAGASKTLMFFDGCQPRLGCTVLLRGASYAELRKAKKILRFMVFGCYSSRLERAFLADEFAIPKNLPMAMQSAGADDLLFDEASDRPQPEAQSSPMSQGGQQPPEGSQTATTTFFDNSSLVIINSESLANATVEPSVMLEDRRDEEEDKVKADGPEEKEEKADLRPVRELDDPLHEYLRSQQAGGLLGGDQSLSSTPVRESSVKGNRNLAPSRTVHSDVLATNSMLFRKALEDTILSVSPLLRHGLPYLETEAGRNAPLRKYLPEVLYYSQQLRQSESPPRKIRYGGSGGGGLLPTDEVAAELSSPTGGRGDLTAETSKVFSIGRNSTASLHPFLCARITPSMSKTELLSLLSDFRARGVNPGGNRLRDQQLANGTTNNKLSLTTSDDWENISSTDQTSAGGNSHLKDCLDPFNLQRLCVLFSSYCPSSAVASQYCVAPWVVEMDYYGRNDIALGGFLERYCFHQQYSCPSAACQSSISSHVRRFVHDTASILVIIRQLANPVNCGQAASTTSGSNSAADDRTILMWSWCKKCKQVSPIATMSGETWHFSFAKYLELRFYGHAYCRRQVVGPSATPGAFPSHPTCACSHPLHTEHFHYFGCRDLVASFKFAPITLKEIVLADPAMNIGREADLLDRLIEEVRMLAQVGLGLYASIGDWLRALTADVAVLGLSSRAKLETALAQMVEQMTEEKLYLRKRIEEVQLMLTSPNLNISSESNSGGEESLWHVADQEVLLKRIIADAVVSWNARLLEVIAAKKKEDKAAASASASTSSSASKSQRNSQSGSADLADPVDVAAIARKDPPPIFTISPNSSRDDDTPAGRKMSDSHQTQSPFPNANDSPSLLRHRNSSSDMLHPANPGHLDTTPVSADPSDPASVQHRRRLSLVNSSNEIGEDVPAIHTKTPVTPSSQSRLSLSALLAMAGGPGAAPLTSPFPSSEHHLLPPSSSVPLVVYQNEPSSIIAYALASVDYEQQLAELQADLADQALLPSASPPRTSSPVGPDRWFEHVEREEPAGKGSGSLASAGPSGNSLAAPSGPPPSSNHHHLEIQFSDQSTKFYCRIYYAEQFRQLRSKVFPAGEERFIRSLSRCAPWAASGGKSGSSFCKTLDDRFVVKQMSKMEIQSFVDLAPNYIAYTQRAHRENRPTAFCKILGAFRIVFKNSATNVASKQDLLVMENLFYQRRVSRKFDLKGSERNRLVSAPEAGTNNDCVLLDENFMKMIWESPLYVRGYSQSVLNKALNADTQFLASQLVMDYSLLVGIDDQTNQLIVGLIDYIRTFTWDKRLETFVKSSGILGGQGKMPTVVSPELYRTRFCEAMNRYFTAVPSFWE